jgi:uncharacterized repeat protein (TIGR01451 family)
VAVDLSVTKIVSNAAPQVGTTVIFTVTLTNLGPNSATGIVLSDKLPTGYTYQSHTASVGIYKKGTGAWSLSTLSADAVATLQMNAMVNGSGVYTNTATLKKSVPPDKVTTNNVATVIPVPVP